MPILTGAVHDPHPPHARQHRHGPTRCGGDDVCGGGALNELSLFTGAGGGILGTHLLGWTPIGYVEWDDYCQRVLAARIADGLIPCAPIFGDVRQFVQSGAARAYQGFADVVTGGFPCQPFSRASRQHKTAIDFWPAMRSVIDAVKPRFVFAENVSRHAIDVAADDCEAMGYQTRCIALSASDLGADHIRQRYWLRAYADNDGELLRGHDAEMADVPRVRPSVWETFSSDSRMADGMAYRMERYKATGNGQVPAVVAAAWELLK